MSALNQSLNSANQGDIAYPKVVVPISTKKVIATMDAVYHLFTEVQPKEMGVEFPQEFVNFYEWVLDRFDRGELDIKKPLGLSVTVHDNCYAKSGGERYFDQARSLLRLAGCELVEMELNRENALC